ncbi:hypothetical protein Pmani_035291 [Petrolisthes manimaculis]|uniref:Phosphoribosylglycinamide synthetase C-domain domain-containing protein n=1 Tax=Petrolisthes manimaculis TaxID=1843537 RepID=A0AAE1NKV1_9EUCA|nr:hypothetical protein Pmani_035291 [Petrolisthes manimaculis]
MEIKGIEGACTEQGVQIYHAGTTLREDRTLVTSGGRVLGVCVKGVCLQEVAGRAVQIAESVVFTGAKYRTDIGAKAIVRQINNSGRLTYESSGVNISSGNTVVSLIKDSVANTHIPGVMGGLGSFGGLFDLSLSGYTDPILVSGTDGVGTKLKIAHDCNQHNTLGQDLVAMCVNDILVHGARPLFFLDYLAMASLDVAQCVQVVEGVAEGCVMAGCALIGGETAEMSGQYPPGQYDLAGFTVGCVSRPLLLPRPHTMYPGDRLIALPSSGLHSNGFSLVRKIVVADRLCYNDQAPFDATLSLGTALLTPTRIYPKLLRSALESGLIKGAAHITGGGLTHNIPRCLPNTLSVTLHATHWHIHTVFKWIFAHGVSSTEMASTYNCGVGMVLVVAEKDVPEVIALIGRERGHGEGQGGQQEGHGEAKVIGVLQERKDKDAPQVIIEDLEKCLSVGLCAVLPMCPSVYTPKKKVAILISGSGTNLQALIEHTRSGLSRAEIVLVISNKENVEGITRAEKAHINTKVIPHGNYPTREAFESTVTRELRSARVDLICLAGFLRVLTGSFVCEWRGRLINVHPSLLPMFKGVRAQRQALQAGVTVSGCTVHFVAEEVDSGAIIAQEAVAVLPDDTEDSLTQRIKTAEHKAYPRALEMVARGEVVLGEDGRCVRT